jgi:hypothetical protein
MQERLWWYDRETYRQRVGQYSDSELADVYYHIDPLKYPDQYRWVLLELRRRALIPTEAARPLPDVQWWLPQWLSRCPFLTHHPLLFHLCMAFASVLLAFILTLGGLFPFWLLAGPLEAVNAIAALFYVALLPIPLYTGFVYTVRGGAQGWLTCFALCGTGSALWLFLQSSFFTNVLEALSRPPHVVPFMNFPM